MAKPSKYDEDFAQEMQGNLHKNSDDIHQSSGPQDFERQFGSLQNHLPTEYVGAYLKAECNFTQLYQKGI